MSDLMPQMPAEPAGQAPAELAMPLPQQPSDAGGVPAGEQRPMSLQDDFERAQAQFEAASAAKEKLDAIQHELDQLGKKADVVTGEEVVQAAGRLIARGLDVKQMATLLADMPAQNGQILGEWLAQQREQVDAAQKQFAPMYQVVKHDLGISALRLMALNSMDGGKAQGGPTAQAMSAAMPLAPGNALMPKR